MTEAEPHFTQSSGHSFHNRFANEKTQATHASPTSRTVPPTSAAETDQQSAPVQGSQAQGVEGAQNAHKSAEPGFNFEFSDFRGIEDTSSPSLRSLLSNRSAGGQASKTSGLKDVQTSQGSVAGQNGAHVSQSAVNSTDSNQQQPSRDVAALEAAVVEAEDAARRSPPSSNAAVAGDPEMTSSGSGRSLTNVGIGNYSRPHRISSDERPDSMRDGAQQQQRQASASFTPPRGHSEPPSQDNSLDNAFQNLDFGNFNGGSKSNAVPPLRSVQAQQPVLSPAAADDAASTIATRFHEDDSGSTPQLPPKERPNSFFGLDGPYGNGQDVGGNEDSHRDYGQAPPLQSSDSASSGFFGGAPSMGESKSGMSAQGGTRPSSFFQSNGQGDDLEPSQAAKIAAKHRNNESGGAILSSDMGAAAAANRSTLAGGTGNAAIRHSASFNHGTNSGRPASIAPSVSTGPLLDHSHLKPGLSANLLSHNKTLELYRQNAKRTNDPDLIYEFAVFMIDASKSMPEAPTGTGPSSTAAQGSKEEVVKEAIGLLKKIAERGHPDAQYFLGDCYANGIGTAKNKQDFDRAYPLFVLAAKHGHSEAAYRAGTCYEKGWGTRRDQSKALNFYRKAASQSHAGAMYRLATAELNGELNLKRSAREGVKWLKRSAEAATPEFPHALHELALLHERGIDNVLFVDPEYSCELLAQAGEMGYAPSAYKLGVNYEYGRMGCPQDAGLSIHMYNIAAQQNHREACFALTAWYLTGAPSILPQSDTEAYLWAKKAAEQGLAKAEYAVGYFTEMGIGTVKNMKESKEWYRRAAEHGDKRANPRLTSLGGRAVQPLPGFGDVEVKDKKRSSTAPAPLAGQHESQVGGSDYSSIPQGLRTQPTNAPFPSRGKGEMPGPSPTATATGAGTLFPSPLTMRDQQSAQREERYLANVAAVQQSQSRSTLPTLPSGQQQQQQQQPTARPPTNGMPSMPSSQSGTASQPQMSNGFGRPPAPQQQQQQQQFARPPQWQQQQQQPMQQGARPPPNRGQSMSPPHMAGQQPPRPFLQGQQVQQMPRTSSPTSMPTANAPQHGVPQTFSAARPPPGPASPRQGSGPARSSASAYPSYPSGGSFDSYQSPPAGQQRPGPGSGPGPAPGAMRPPPINTNLTQGPGQARPPQNWPQSAPNSRPSQPNAPNLFASPASDMRSPAQMNAAGGMPFGLASDDATAAQIFQRAQQQQGKAAGPASAGPVDGSMKKKKGWFGK